MQEVNAESVRFGESGDAMDRHKVVKERGNRTEPPILLRDVVKYLGNLWVYPTALANKTLANVSRYDDVSSLMD